jgi:hypothetical protein
MIRSLKQALPLPAAFGVVLLTVVLHGLWTDRWVVAGAVEESVARLDRLPERLGDWEGSPLEMSAHEVALAGGAGHLARVYRNRVSGESVTVILLCGRPGPLSVHTPDVCYRGLGYLPTAQPVAWTPPAAGSAEFFTAKFRKDGPDGARFLRILWAWGADGAWQAPANPRLTFAQQPALYKLYLVRSMAREDESLKTGACVDFLREFLPAAERALFSPRSQAAREGGT